MSIAQPYTSAIASFEAMLSSEAIVATMPSSFSLMAALSWLDVPSRERLPLFTPLYYTETPRLSSFYRSITSRAWQKRLGVREACRAPVHPNLTALVPWHMHSMPPALHSSVGGGAGDHSYMTFLKMLAKGLIK